MPGPRRLLPILLIALGALAPLPALAWSHGGHHFAHHHFRHHHFHHHFGFGLFAFGPPLFWWPQPYYYAVPRYVIPDEGVVYVQKFDGKPGPNTPPNQIFCPTKGAYYPQVQDCPNGWQRVTR